MDAMLRRLGSFPVNRGARDEWAMQHAERVLAERQVLGIFPEGTRSREGALRTAKTGAARLAIASDCPILPLAVTGTRKIFKQGLQQAKETVQVGRPIHPALHDSAQSLTDRLMFALASMLPHEMRGAYTGHSENS